MIRRHSHLGLLAGKILSCSLLLVVGNHRQNHSREVPNPDLLLPLPFQPDSLPGYLISRFCKETDVDECQVQFSWTSSRHHRHHFRMRPVNLHHRDSPKQLLANTWQNYWNLCCFTHLAWNSKHIRCQDSPISKQYLSDSAFSRSHLFRNRSTGEGSNPPICEIRLRHILRWHR